MCYTIIKIREQPETLKEMFIMTALNHFIQTCEALGVNYTEHNHDLFNDIIVTVYHKGEISDYHFGKLTKMFVGVEKYERV